MDILTIFLLMFCLLLPLIIILIGKSMKKNAPKKINNVYGYRTSMSMKNEETWKFAHNYCGKLWIRLGIIMMMLSGIVLTFSFTKGIDIFCITGSIIVIVQTILLVLSVFIVELALKNNFDEHGNRK